MGVHVRTARKLLLGREIAHMIAQAGVSQAEAAKIIETSQSRMTGLINGTGSITVGDLDRLADHLGFTDPGYKEALQTLRRDSHKRGFWSTGYNRAYHEDFRLLVDLEKHAETERTCEIAAVPGLLQTEEFVRGMYRGALNGTDVSHEDMVQARLARQKILGSSDGPTQHFVLDESCLRRMWSPDRALMARQIEHIIELSKLPRVMIQVLPFDTVLPDTFLHQFVYLQVPSPGVTGPLQIVYVENRGEFRYLDDKKTLAAYDDGWSRLTSAALSYEQSRAFMREIARGYKGK